MKDVFAITRLNNPLSAQYSSLLTTLLLFTWFNMFTASLPSRSQECADDYGNKRNVKRMLPELIEWSESHDRPFSFVTEASVNLAEDNDLLELMRRANFRRVFLGIETPVPESLKEAQKGQNTRRDLLDSVKKIQSYGIEVMAGFIVGFDNDPEDIFDRQIDFIRESAIPLAMAGLLTALPDTQRWRRLEREGRLLKESTGNNTDGSLNFIPRMDTKRLIEGYQRILRTIYTPSEYYRRSLDCLSRLSQKPEPRRNHVISDVTAFLRVSLALGVRDHERAEFWRYLKRTITANRENFAHGDSGGYGLSLSQANWVYFRVSYDVVEQTTSAQLLTATFQLSSRQTDEVSKVVEVVTRTSSTMLNEQRPGQASWSSITRTLSI